MGLLELFAEGFEFGGEPFELLAQAADFFFELADAAAAGGGATTDAGASRLFACVAAAEEALTSLNLASGSVKGARAYIETTFYTY